MPVRVHIVVDGRVQGVCFRHYCREQAERLGVKGFVRNKYDGKVEIVAEGEDEVVGRFAAWCRRGPPAARVLSCVEKQQPPTGEFESFAIEYES